MVQAMFSVLWSTVVMELWKRRSSTQSYRWGTLHLAERFAEPRPGFQGNLGVNPVTGRVEPLFPEWQRDLIIAAVSLPVVGAFLGARALWAKSIFKGEPLVFTRRLSSRRLGGGGNGLLLLGGGPGPGATQRLGLPVVSDFALHAFHPSHRLHEHARHCLQVGGSGFDRIR